MEKTRRKLNSYFIPLLIALFLYSCKGKEDKKVASTAPPALEELNKAIEKNPRDAKAWYNRANYYFKKRDVGHAGEDMIKVLELDTNTYEFLLLAADIHLTTNQSGKCKAALDRCLAINPKGLEALIKMAELYLYVKQNALSNEYVNRALDIDKDNTRALFILGINQKESGDTAKAIYAFQRIIDLKPDEYDALMQVGMLYAARNNILCMEYLKKAAILRPSSYEPYFNSALYHQKNGNIAAAVRDYRAALKCKPESAITWYNFGVLHSKNTLDYEQAIVCFTKAITYDPSFEEAYYMRGRAYEKKGNPDLARQDFTEALHINPDYEKAFDGMKRLDK